MTCVLFEVFRKLLDARPLVYPLLICFLAHFYDKLFCAPLEIPETSTTQRKINLKVQERADDEQHSSKQTERVRAILNSLASFGLGLQHDRPEKLFRFMCPDIFGLHKIQSYTFLQVWNYTNLGFSVMSTRYRRALSRPHTSYLPH